jgi:hypothetical protein
MMTQHPVSGTAPLTPEALQSHHGFVRARCLPELLLWLSIHFYWKREADGSMDGRLGGAFSFSFLTFEILIIPFMSSQFYSTWHRRGAAI